ncbi:hypothetical protein G6F56_010434 [Rhizopus delemar]|nr:hypothetical protein G6F56_010434 [Rhizopus delemar]
MSLGFTSASLGISGLVFTQLNDRLFKSKTEQDISTFQFLIFFGCTTALITLFASFILGPIRFGLLNTSSDNTASVSNSSSTREELDPLLSKNAVEIEEDEINVYGSAVFLDPIGLSLCLSLVVLLGLGYVYLANIGSLITSLSMDEMNLSEAQHLRNLHISIFSVSNCLTRASLGTLSDLLQKRAGVHRIWFIWSGALGLFFASLSLVTFVSDENDLLVYSVWVAIPYGIAFGIAPAIISEFGTKSFARNWGWVMCAPAIGSQLFNLLFGFVYTQELEDQEGDVCRGIICFKTTFIVGAMTSLVCALILSVAIYRKRLYKFHLN